MAFMANNLTFPAKQRSTNTRTRRRLLAGWLAALSPTLGLAVEIGAPSTQPALGQPLRMEIPLSIPGEASAPKDECVHLTPRSDDSDANYFPKGARATVETNRGISKLIVTSSGAVTEPVVGFRVVVACGAGLSREFMFLASPREILTPASAQVTPVSEVAPGQSPKNELVLTRNTTLNKLASGRYPSNRQKRDEFRRLMAEANPELFAGAGDHVGAVPIPVGTVLKVPDGLPKSAAKSKKSAAAVESTAATELPEATSASQAQPAHATKDATKDADIPPPSPRKSLQNDKPPQSGQRKPDRLVIGGEGRIPSLSPKELKQALDRLEQMVGEKSRSDIAMSETLTSLAASFGEVKDYVKGVDERVKHAEAEQARAQAELQKLQEESRNSYSLLELLAAIIGGGAVGAGLIAAYQRFTMRRQAEQPLGGQQAGGVTATVSAVQTAPADVRPAQPGYATEQKSVAAARPVNSQSAQSKVRGTHAEPAATRVEPTAPRSTIEHAVQTAREPKGGSAQDTVPTQLAAASPLQKGSEATQTKVSGSHVEFSTAETKFELELPKAGMPESAQTSRNAAPGTAGAAGLAVPAAAGAETELVLSLDSGEGPLTEGATPADNSIDPVLELADVMTSLGLAKEAASAIVEHLRQNPHQDVSHWFKVLEIYRSTGHRDGFDEAVQELRGKINVNIDDWDAPASKTDKTSLEQYPHIMKQLQDIWIKPECEEFLTKLLEDNRGGKRAGFPQVVAEEILMLKAMLRHLPRIDFPPITVTETVGEEQPDLSESKAWREFRMIP